MNDRGWIFADVLVALAILTLALYFIFPAATNLQTMQIRQEQRLHAAFEADSEDAGKPYR